VHLITAIMDGQNFLEGYVPKFGGKSLQKGLDKTMTPPHLYFVTTLPSKTHTSACVNMHDCIGL